MIRSAAALYRGAQNNSNFGVISFENRVDYVENSTNNEEFPPRVSHCPPAVQEGRERRCSRTLNLEMRWKTTASDS